MTPVRNTLYRVKGTTSYEVQGGKSTAGLLFNNHKNQGYFIPQERTGDREIVHNNKVMVIQEE